MIKNFIVDNDLEAYYPDFVNYRRGGQLDFSDTISKAFDVVIRDIINRGFNPRLMMIPIDLNRDADTTENYQHLVSRTVSANDSGYAWEGSGREGRFVVNISSRTADTGWTFELQGSNETERPDDASTYWETLSTVSIAVNGSGTTNYLFTDLHKWYRLKVTLASGVGSIAFTCGVYETAYDHLIVHKTMEIAFAQWTTRLSNQWEFRYERARVDYEAALGSTRFAYDADEDGLTEDDSVKKVGGSITSVRAIA